MTGVRMRTRVKTHCTFIPMNCFPQGFKCEVLKPSLMGCISKSHVNVFKYNMYGVEWCRISKKSLILRTWVAHFSRFGQNLIDILKFQWLLSQTDLKTNKNGDVTSWILRPYQILGRDVDVSNNHIFRKNDQISILIKDARVKHNYIKFSNSTDYNIF